MLTGQYLLDILQPCYDDGYEISFNDGRDRIDIHRNLGKINCNNIYINIKLKDPAKTMRVDIHRTSNVAIKNIDLFKSFIDEIVSIDTNLKSDGVKFYLTMNTTGYFSFNIYNTAKKMTNEKNSFKIGFTKEYIEDVLQALEDDSVSFSIEHGNNDTFVINFFAKSSSPYQFSDDEGPNMRNRYRNDIMELKSLFNELPNIVDNLLEDGYSSSFDIEQLSLVIYPYKSIADRDKVRMMRAKSFFNENVSDSNIDYEDFLGRYYNFKCRNYETGEVIDILLTLVNTYITADKISLIFFDKRSKNFKLNIDSLSKYSGFDRNSDKFYDNLSLLEIDNEGSVVEQFFVKPSDNISTELITYTKKHCS